MITDTIIDIDIDQNDQKLAGIGRRFGNYIIDSIGFFFLIFLHAMILDGLLGLIPEGGSPWLGAYFFFLYIMYFVLFEYFFSKTPGKFLTKTHVVTISGQHPTFLNILGRNLCRLIPFDHLSFLISSNGWHDEFSKTMVICDK